MGTERVRRPVKGIWIELIGFDNTQPDFGVREYLSRMPVKPEFVSLLLFDAELLHTHVGLEHDFPLGDLQCSYFGRPFNEERRRQGWTAFQLRGLVAELKKHGLDVFPSFFDFVVTPDRAKRHNVRRREVVWIDGHPEMLSVDRSGKRRDEDFCLWKHLADGTLYEDFFVNKLIAFLKDYGFTGFHGSDGFGHPRLALCNGDFSPDMTAQFAEFAGLTLPELPLPEIADWILSHEREAWSRFHAERHAALWRKIASALKCENLRCYLNSCWTRDPFEALFRYGVDYRKLAASGIDGFIVEASAAVCELEGWNKIEPDSLDQRLAAVQRLKAMVPATPLVLLGATKDGMEQYDALRHAPTWMRAESYTLNNLFCEGKRCTEGVLICLGDGMTPGEWRTIDAVHTLACSGDNASPLPPVMHTVWSTKAFEEEFSAYAAKFPIERFPSSNTLLTEMLHAGVPLASQLTVEQLAKAEEKLPLAVFNPRFLPEDEWELVKKHADLLFLAGVMRDGNFRIELWENGRQIFREAAELDAPGTDAEPTSWLEPLPECGVRDRGIYARTAQELNARVGMVVPDADCTALQTWGWFTSGKTLRILARNRLATYLNGVLRVRGKVGAVRILSEDPILPVKFVPASDAAGETLLTAKIPPHGAVILEAELR